MRLERRWGAATGQSCLWAAQRRPTETALLYALLTAELRGSPQREHRTALRTQTCFSHGMSRPALPQASRTPRLPRLKIKRTDPWEEETQDWQALQTKRQHLCHRCLHRTLLEAGGVFGRSPARLRVRCSPWQARGCWCTTLRKPKSPPWKGGPQKEKPSDDIKQQTRKGGGVKSLIICKAVPGGSAHSTRHAPESQNGRGWKGPLGTPSPTPAKAGSPRAGCTGPCPGGAGISPEKETPQPLWAALARAPSPQQHPGSQHPPPSSVLPADSAAPRYRTRPHAHQTLHVTLPPAGALSSE